MLNHIVWRSICHPSQHFWWKYMTANSFFLKMSPKNQWFLSKKDAFWDTYIWAGLEHLIYVKSYSVAVNLPPFPAFLLKVYNRQLIFSEDESKKSVIFQPKSCILRYLYMSGWVGGHIVWAKKLGRVANWLPHCMI